MKTDEVEWAPPEWTCCGFPLAGQDREEMRLDLAIVVLLALADTITESDSTALGPAMHVAHMLVSRQGRDGRWPASLNAKTGETIGHARTGAPLKLYRRLAQLLETTEFDRVITQATSKPQCRD